MLNRGGVPCGSLERHSRGAPRLHGSRVEDPRSNGAPTSHGPTIRRAVGFMEVRRVWPWFIGVVPLFSALFHQSAPSNREPPTRCLLLALCARPEEGAVRRGAWEGQKWERTGLEICIVFGWDAANRKRISHAWRGLVLEFNMAFG